MTDHVPSKASVERCARALEPLNISFERAIAAAVLRCAVEECGYQDARYLEMLEDDITVANSRVEKAEAECATLRARSPTHELGYALTCAEEERDRLRAALEEMTKDRDMWMAQRGAG